MKAIIACGSIQPELDKLCDKQEVKTYYLPQNLHRTPQKMANAIQDIIKKIPADIEKVILGYGLCSNGIVGVEAPAQGLYIPKIHDCIALYLGSRKKYNEIFKNHPGTYHLTQSWIENEKDPLGLLQNEYTERVGREMAEEAMQHEIKNYEHISYINTGTGDVEKNRQRAKENAKYFGKTFIEYKGTNQYFKKILEGPYQNDDFVYIEPHQKVKQIQFLK